MYPRNAASPEPVAIGAVVQISDGAVQTSGCTVRIKPIGVAEGDGGGTTAYSTDGIVLYTPTQAETNYTSFILIAKKTGCIPACVTVVTTASSVPGRTMPADGSITAAVIATDAIDADAIKADAVTEIQAGLATPTNITAATGITLAAVTHTGAVIPTVTTLTGHTPQTGDTYALANGSAGFVAIDTVVDAIKLKTDNLPTDPADQSAVEAAITAATSPLATAANLATVAGYLDTEIAAILADTNEMQTDWADGGRLDLILDARASQVSVDDLPTNAELATALGTADDAVLAAIATVQSDTNDIQTRLPAALESGRIAAALDSASRLAIWNELTTQSFTADSFGELLIISDGTNGREVKVTGANHIAADVHDVQPDGLTNSTEITNIENASGYLLAVLAGACADPQTASETYAITVFGSTFTVDMAGQTSTGTRTAPTLTKT